MRSVTSLHENVQRLFDLLGLERQDGVAVSVVDPAGATCYVNAAFCRMTDATAAELIGRPRALLDARGSGARLAGDCRATLQQGRIWRGESGGVRKDGSLYWLASTVYPVFAATVTPIAYVEVAQELLAAPSGPALSPTTELHLLLESLPQLIWSCRGDGPCDYLSRQWVEYTGIPESLQLDYGWLDQLHPDDRQATIDRWTQVAPKGDEFDVRFRIRRHDGVYRWFQTRAKRWPRLFGQ